MEVKQIIGNANESMYADAVVYEIKNYEVNTGIKIKKLGVCYDKTPDMKAEKIYFTFDAKAILYLHIKRPIEFVKVPKTIVQKNFANKDWQGLNVHEQIVFDKNIAYVCVY